MRAKYILYMGGSLLFFVSMICEAHKVVHEQKTDVSFESPFYASWYKKALDACMHAWESMNELKNCVDITFSERVFIIDSTLGKLVYADFCLEHMQKNDDFFLYHDDAYYLLQVIEKLEESHEHIKTVLLDEYNACFVRMIQGMRSKIIPLT